MALQEDLESLAVLFNTVKSLGGVVDEERERKMANAFETHLQTVVKRLNDRLKTMTEKAERNAEILLAKHGLYDLCFQELITHSGGFSPQMQDSLRTICDVHADLFQLLEGVLSATVAENVEMKQNFERSEAESAQLLQAATTLEREAEGHKNEIIELKRQLSELRVRNRQLESKQDATAQYKGIDANPKGGSGPSSAKKSPGRGGSRGPPNSGTPGKRKGPVASSGTSQKQANGEMIIRDDVATGGAYKGSPSTSTYTIRMLSLKQLKDFISQIYESKDKYDTKCRAQSLPRETMEQHMYSYMNHRFGLKQLIIENVAAVLRGVGTYAQKDNDVAVFQKIINNDIDEEFRRVQQQIKDTVSDLLRIHLKGKNRLKSDEVVGTLLKEKMTGFLVEEEWTNIIKYMYNAEDSDMLTRITLDFVEKNARDPQNPDVSYADLTTILLDFQLRGHDRFLLRFRELFQKLDTDEDGVLSEAEFRTLVSRVNPTRDANDAAELLATADPSGAGQVTYSDAVACLSPDIVDMMITVARTVGTSAGRAGDGAIFGDTYKTNFQ
jgi:Ca2+-binding EF-hand superfamily protein